MTCDHELLLSSISSFFLFTLSGNCAEILHRYRAQVARQQCFPGVLALVGHHLKLYGKSRCMNTWMHLRIILPGSQFATARQSLVIWRLVLPVTASCASPYGLNCRRGVLYLETLPCEHDNTLKLAGCYSYKVFILSIELESSLLLPSIFGHTRNLF